jgi:ADP-ribose pyrophosphatase YjhB (NUDIX family)
MSNEDKRVYYVAAGGVVVWEQKVLLLNRPSHNEMRLPKGHIDPGEQAVTAALREVGEESGYWDLTVLADLGTQVVTFSLEGQEIERTERYFLMTLANTDVPQASEAQFMPVWLGWDEALRRLTFAAEQEWLRRAQQAAEALT